ncbi:hypothetical protein EMMF5_003037 [Cystobasidiomycetes sp. EMM_F5]
MKASVPSVLGTSLVFAFGLMVAQQAGARPHLDIEAQMHMLARNPEIDSFEAGQHRRHHTKRSRNNRRACSANTNSNTQVKVAYNAGGSSSGSSNTKSTSTTAAAASTSTSSSSSSSTSNGSTSSASGSVTAFSGTNSNAILSWFRTNSGSDSTNGQSWCQTKYQDDWICFAPDVTTMLKEYNNDYNAAATAFCGREAIVTDPSTGKSITAFICDGFDSKWVKTPASLDLTVAAFTAIKGSFDNNKNTVIQGATWKLTGNVVAKGKFKAS